MVYVTNKTMKVKEKWESTKKNENVKEKKVNDRTHKEQETEGKSMRKP